ncbi:membrane protein insertion efficiency factor YidD [Tenacibaculum ovolyticum]|uniref:membrane protein insertion efficiency factor YidD n=1 Tax=Tenacibaculum ovolyticum TaxID=104270 RepID=UPI0003F69740|nr:membrane protein insertion efficiency factor YidD [Tenacibaculum ovolyticum]
MKYALIFSIKVYWFLKPKGKAPCCIFRKSCSHYVYEKTINEGFVIGFEALKFRIKNCRQGFELFSNPISNKTQMMLLDKSVIDEHNIAERLLN